jgi:hypothetical protein
MTPKQSLARLAIYVAATTVSSASAGLAVLDFADSRQVASYALGIVGTALITARSYIDKSHAEVEK